MQEKKLNGIHGTITLKQILNSGRVWLGKGRKFSQCFTKSHDMKAHEEWRWSCIHS